MSSRNSAPIGIQGNAWPLGTAISAGFNSQTVDTWSCPFVSAFGHANAAATITLLGSMDGSLWFKVATQVLAGAGDFCINVTCAARYFVLQSSAGLDVTSTGTIAACGEG